MPPKRSAASGAGGGGGAKRAKAWRPAGKAGMLSEGLRGVLVTCHTHRMREAAGEALALIRDRIAEHATAATAAAGGAEAGGGLDAELAALRQEREKLYQVDTGIKGVLLIALRPSAGEVEPEALVAGLFEEMQAGRVAVPREVIRLTPLALTLKGRLADAEKALPALLEPFFGADAPPTRWNVVFKKRSTSPDVTAREWVPALAKLVDARHPVDLENPEVSVLVEVFRASCGLCVSRNFHRCQEFNCQKVEPPT